MYQQGTGGSTNRYLKGSGIDTAAIVATENTAAHDAGIDAWAFDFYLPASITHAADPNDKHEQLQAGLDGYLASSNKSLMKFWVTVIVDQRFGLSYPSTNNWKYLTDFSNYVRDLTNDAQYLKIGGKPVIGLFSSGGQGPAMSLGQWQSFLAPMGGQSGVFAVQMSCSSADATTFSTQAKFCYGVQNNSGTGHQAWTTIEGKDQTRWSESLAGGFSRIAQINATIDARPLDNSVQASRVFLDQPTMPQWYGHARDGLAVSGSNLTLVFWNELFEEGQSLIPSVQEGTRYLDGFKWARTHVLPSTYTYELNLFSLEMTNVGTWTYVDPFSGSAVGAHDNDEITSLNTGDSKALTHPNMTECALYAKTGPDRGILDVEVDDADVADVDLYSASPAQHVLVWTSSTLSNASHKCEFIVKGTKNASSSSVKIGLDSIRVTYKPSG